MEQDEPGNPSERSWSPGEPYDSTMSHFATGFGPLDNFSLDDATGAHMASDADYISQYIAESMDAQGFHTGNGSSDADMNEFNLNSSWTPEQQGLGAASQWPQGYGNPASPLTYVEPPFFPTSEPPSATHPTESTAESVSGYGTGTEDSAPAGAGHLSTPPPIQQSPDGTSNDPGQAPRPRRRAMSTTFSIDQVDGPEHSVRVSPNPSTDATDSAVNFYGVYREASKLQTVELFEFIPLPLHLNRVDPSNLPLPTPLGTPISVSRFLRRGATHSTLVEFQEFVNGILLDDTLNPRERAVAIEDRAADIIEEWGRAYLAALITSAHLSTLSEDIKMLLQPFENSIEVTLLLAIASQFNLTKRTKEDVLMGWRFVFDEERKHWYDPCCVTPALHRLTEWFTRFLITGISLSLSLTQSEKHLPDLAHCISIGAWGEVAKILLELAASGGYLHHFRLGPSPTAGSGPRFWDMTARPLPGQLCLLLANRLGPNSKPDKPVVVELFRHLVLCSITTWLVNFLVQEGVDVAIEQYIEGTNPFIECPEVEGNYVPPWAWITAVSSGFISVALGGIEEFGFLGATPEAIFANGSLMQLFTIKIQCTRALLIDLWIGAGGRLAREHINWVSLYNLLKARLAIGDNRLHTNASCLYIAWDPATQAWDADGIPDFRGRNPEYSKSFLDSYRKLAVSANQGDIDVLPYGQVLADLYQKSYLVASERMSERVQELFSAQLLNLSARTTASVGPEIAERMQAILSCAKERATKLKMETSIPNAETQTSLLDAMDQRERRLEIKALEDRSRVAPVPLNPRGIERPNRRVVTPPAIVRTQSLPSFPTPSLLLTESSPAQAIASVPHSTSQATPSSSQAPSPSQTVPSSSRAPPPPHMVPSSSRVPPPPQTAPSSSRVPPPPQTAPSSSRAPPPPQTAPSSSRGPPQTHVSSLVHGHLAGRLSFRGLNSRGGRGSGARGTGTSHAGTDQVRRETVYPGQGSFQIDGYRPLPPPPPPPSFRMVRESPLRGVAYAEAATPPSEPDLHQQEEPYEPS